MKLTHRKEANFIILIKVIKEEILKSFRVGNSVYGIPFLEMDRTTIVFSVSKGDLL